MPFKRLFFSRGNLYLYPLKSISVPVPANIKKMLDAQLRIYNHPRFIEKDPVSIPHLFTRRADIEIAGLFAAVFAWGNRTTIIHKATELMRLMHMQPQDFVLHYTPGDMARLSTFKHRTFCFDDLVFFLEFLRGHYKQFDSLEPAFTKGLQQGDATIENGLNAFRDYFFRNEHLKRTEKHIASPRQKSACKRLNMFLRWMVRSDEKGVDFGIWKHIAPRQLVCPLDLHVARVARRYGLLKRKQNDWEAAIELTAALRKLDKNDPVKYDFALFGLGISEHG